MPDRNTKRICSTCGKTYNYCAHCGEYNPREPWRYLWCSEWCMDLFHVCSEYNQGNIDAQEAKSRLRNLDISSNKSLHPKLAETIRRILND